MKTVKITQEMVEGIESAECRQEFVNALNSMLKDQKPTIDIRTSQALCEGLKVGFPDLRIKVTFDSYKMNETKIIGYNLIEAGYVPVDLDCEYEDYEYRDLDDMSDSEIEAFYEKVERKIYNNMGETDPTIFFQYILDSCTMCCLAAGRGTCVGFAE